MKSFKQGDQVLVLRAHVANGVVRAAAHRAVIGKLNRDASVSVCFTHSGNELMSFKPADPNPHHPGCTQVVHADELPDRAAIKERLSLLLDAHIRFLVADAQKGIEELQAKIDKLNGLDRSIQFEVKD